MASSNLIKQLQERGLVAQVTDEEALAERLAQGPIALYCGFDPTADSLHLGHLVPLLCLKRFHAGGPQAGCAGRRRDGSDWRPELQSCRA